MTHHKIHLRLHRLAIAMTVLALVVAAWPSSLSAQGRPHPKVEAYMERCNPLVGDPVILRMADTLAQMSLELEDTEGIVSAPVLPFHYYLHTNQEDSMAHYATQAKNIAIQYGRTDYYFMVWERYISYQAGRRRYSLAQRELDEMHRMALQLNDPAGLLSCYKNLSLVYYYKGNYKQAADYARQAIQASRNIPDNEYETGLCYIELARVLSKMGLHAECADELLRAIPPIDKSLVTAGENDIMMALMHSMLTSAYVAMGDLDKAREALATVDAHMRDNYNYYDIIKAHSDYYCAVGQYQRALDWQNRFYTVLGTTNTFSYYRDMSEILSHIPGREKEAAQLALAYVHFSDSIQAAEQEAYFADVAADMDLYRIQNDNQHMRIRTIQILLVAMGVLFLVALFFLFHFLRLWRKLRQMKGHQQAQDDQTALGQEIQTSMLKHEYPANKHYELYATLRPAMSVSGDLFDFIEEGGKLYFIIADVAGKGVPAALYMSEITYNFRAQARQADSAAQLMQNINRVVSEDNPHCMFATALCGIIDLVSGSLSLCNAGHHLPVCMTRHGDPSMAYTLKQYDLNVNLPLGVDAHTKYVSAEQQLQPGDKMFLFTDGLTDATNSRQEIYGTERLLALLLANTGTSAHEITDLVIQNVLKFVDDAPQCDDITMLAIVYKQ